MKTTTSIRPDWKNVSFRIFLIAVMAAFFVNLFGGWFDQSYASVALLTLFAIGVAVYRRLWIPDRKQTSGLES